MQSLFALQQCRDANYDLCLERLNETFSPNLNSMEVQDKAVLTLQKKQSVKLFQKAFSEGEFPVEAEDKAVEAKVNECLIFYKEQGKKDLTFLKKTLINEVEKIFENYVAVLSLLPAFAKVAEADQKVSHKNFVNNLWVKAFVESEALKKISAKLKRDWSNKNDVVRGWFRDVVRQDNEYLLYLDKKNPTAEDQKKFVNHLFRRVILGKTIINDHFEEEVLRWAEDQLIVRGMVEKTVKSFHPDEPGDIVIYTLSVNWEEDKEFIEILFDQASNLTPEYKELISRNTRNWEVERLPMTDRVILEMAIAELLQFPNIPVKVTINEYIELAKSYSTPKSRQFINGILDVISKELSEVGAVKKSGRGLIDNK